VKYFLNKKKLVHQFGVKWNSLYPLKKALLQKQRNISLQIWGPHAPRKKKRKKKGPLFQKQRKISLPISDPHTKTQPLQKQRENLVYQFEVPIPPKEKKKSPLWCPP